MSCTPDLADAVSAATHAENAVTAYTENPTMGTFWRANRLLRAAFMATYAATGISPDDVPTRDAPTLIAELRRALCPVERQLLDG